MALSPSLTNGSKQVIHEPCEGSTLRRLDPTRLRRPAYFAGALLAWEWIQRVFGGDDLHGEVLLDAVDLDLPKSCRVVLLLVGFEKAERWHSWKVIDEARTCARIYRILGDSPFCG